MSIKNRAIKYRMHPSDKQWEFLNQTFGCVRKVFNDALEMQMGLYDGGFRTMSKNELNNYVNRAWKVDFPFLREVDKFALTNAIYNMNMAFKNFFEKRAAYPKFKSKKDKHQSYTTNWSNNNIQIVPPEKKGTVRGWVKLPKLGLVSAVIHRLPCEDWAIKSATVSLDNTGKCYVSILFAYEQEMAAPAPIPDKEKAIGLDYSSPLFYVDSNGEDAGTPHCYRKTETKLTKEQRKLSKMEKGSSNYRKQKLRVGKLHQKVARQRLDFCHKRSREIANSYDAVCVEDLNLRAMSQTLTLGKSTMDNGFGTFREFLKYKLEDQGKYFVVISKWYPSSKTCHKCGHINPDLRMEDREWVCPKCGASVSRDHNAAQNIRDEGLRILWGRALTQILRTRAQAI